MLADVYTVRAILAEKDRPDPLHVPPDLAVIQLLDILKEKNEEAALVMEGGRFLGIVTENDHARKVDLHARSANKTTVAEIMTPAEKVISVGLFKSLEGVSILMQENHIRHVPVIEGGELLGMISIWDVLRGIIHHQIFVGQQYLGAAGGPT